MATRTPQRGLFCTRDSGGEAEKYYRDGHILEIGEYCESDVLNTYRVSSLAAL